MPTAYEYDGPRTSVCVTRRLDASPERVFDAWIDPVTASRWLFTTKTSKTACDMDIRIGGSYTITRTRGGKQYVAVGKYLEVNRPHRLVFTFGMPQFAADFDTIAVEIVVDTDGCIVTLRQEGLRPGYEPSTTSGWEKMFDLLAAALE